MPCISLIILAAGGSTRLGRPKQLVVFRGETLLRHAAKTALASVVDGPVIVVLGNESNHLKKNLSDLPVEIVVNANWKFGLGSSIRAGMEALRDGRRADAVLMMVCDQPMVTPELLNTLIDNFKMFGAPIGATQYGKTIGVPALFAKNYFDDLLSLEDDQGAKKIISSNLNISTVVPFLEGIADVDTEDDVAGLERYSLDC
jgi:molybdenum cofactor cytidylyltransferase